MGITVKDPTADIIKSFNELMFRAAVAGTNTTNLTSLIDHGLSAVQTPKANQTSIENVYHSDVREYSYLLERVSQCLTVVLAG